MENIEKELLEKTRYEALEYLLTEQISKKITKEELQKIYNYIFFVSEKANSICDPINIPLEEMFEFIQAIGEILDKNRNIDFNEIGIKQNGSNFEFVIEDGKNIATYKIKAKVNENQFNYQPSNIEYAKENVKYREERISQIKKLDNIIPRLFLENEELFYEKAKERLKIMINETKLRKSKKIERMEDMRDLLSEDEIKKILIEEVMGEEYDYDEEDRSVFQDQEYYEEEAIFKILKVLEESESIEEAKEIKAVLNNYNLLANKNFLIKAEKKSEKFAIYAEENAQKEISENEEIMKKIILENINMLKYTDNKLKAKKGFFINILDEFYKGHRYTEEEIKLWENLIETISDELFSDEEMILNLAEVLTEEYYCTVKQDTELYYKIYNLIIDRVDSKLKNNPGFIKKIPEKEIGILFAGEELKANKEFMLEMLEKDLYSYINMDNQFKVDKDIIELLLKSDYDEVKDVLRWSKIFCDEELIKLIKTKENLKEYEGFMELYKSIQRDEIGESIKLTNKIATHFGDDLDNKAAIYAIQRWAEDNDIIKIGHPIEVVRVPAGQVKSGVLNVDTGGHKGSKIINDRTIIIDGNLQDGEKSASEALSKLGIYVPEQIVELADTKLNKVSSLDSRSALALVRNLSGEQIFKLAEAGLLDKSLDDSQLEEYGLTDAHKKQEDIINKALEKINKYTIELSNGEKMVLAPEQILAGSSIAYEKGISYYASASSHFDKKGYLDGVTFAITSKPETKLPEEVIKFGQELVEKYRRDTNTSGVFVSPNGQMIVAGGLKNPEFKIENETVEEILEKIKDKFNKKDLSKESEIR